MLKIVRAAAEGEIQLEKLNAWQVETFYPPLTLSRGGMLFAGVQVSGGKYFCSNLEQVILRII